jgi:peptidoglycan/LPS O-acetylase OafA/YrhL
MTAHDRAIMSADAHRLPALDGLRSVAVMLVIAFHSGISALRGGFVGVDVFFVLSGFVIVRAMLAEVDRSGTITLAGFWRRRIARLVPAMVVCVIVSAGLFTLTSSPPERVDVLADARASLLSVSNWWFLNQSTDYFRDAVESSPFVHMWSLSAEEQFYVVLPLVFLAGSRWLRTPRAWIAASLLLTFAATAWSIYAHTQFTELRVYFGSDTRIYQVLWGATAAVLSSRSRRTVRALQNRAVGPALLLAGWTVLAVVSCVDGIDPNTRGMCAAAAAVALICPLAARGRGISTAVLATAPVRGLGEVSYGVYLWHWPVIVVLQRLFVLDDARLFVAATVISVVLAYASRRLIELPIIGWARRRKAGVRRALPFGILAAPIIAAILIAPAVLSSSISPLAAASRPGFSLGRQNGDIRPTDLRVPDDLGMSGFAPFEKGAYCINTTEIDGDCLMVDGGPLKVLVFGDSHADDLLPGLAIEARSQGFSLYAVVTAGCPWQRSLAYINFDTPSCVAAQDAVYDGILERVRPDVIVVSAHAHVETGFELRERDSPTDAANIDPQVFLEASVAAAADLTSHGGHLVIIEPRPISPFNAQNCLAVSEWIDDCAFVAGPNSRAEAERLRTIAGRIDESSTVSIEDLICPRFPVCDPILRGTIVRYDADHLYAGFVQVIGDLMWSRILAAGT